jgi:hypothetical protein
VESLRVRCPQCTKLFLVQTKDIRETRPRFECASCHERFWIPYPECVSLGEIIGSRIDHWESRAPIPETKADGEAIAPMISTQCPKCKGALAAGAEECPHCGVIPRKFLSLKTASRIQGSERLSVLWKEIIDDYENVERHATFIKISSIENNLAYASAQYAQLLKLMPTEERATQMIKEIEALVSIPISQSRSIRIQNVREKTPRWIKAAFAIGALMVAAGIFFPLLRNLTGLGAVLVFLALGYRMKFFRF